MEFRGLAKIVDNKLLAGAVRSVIDSSIAGALVMPNVFGVNMGTEEQGVDRALLRQPKPLGILRVVALRAENLPAHNKHLFREADSNPYCKLALADDEWRSPVIHKTCNPDWS